MPFVWTTLLHLAALSTVPTILAQPETNVASSTVGEPLVVDRIIAETWPHLSVPFATCLSSEPDELLTFDLHIDRFPGVTKSGITFDGQELDIVWQNGRAESSQLLTLHDQQGKHHTVNVTWSGTVSPTQGPNSEPLLHFILRAVPEAGSNVECRQTDASPELPDVAIIGNAHSGSELIQGMATSNLIDLSMFSDDPNGDVYSDDGSDMTVIGPTNGDEDEYDLAGELESLRLLEAQANKLQAQIDAKKQSIAPHIREHRDKLCLKHLIKECDGIVCAAKVIFQRLCDKIGIETDPTSGYAKMADSHISHMVAFHEQQKSANTVGQQFSEKHHMHLQIPTSPLANSQKDFSTGSIGLAQLQHQHPFVKAFSILAAALGLTALVLLIRKRCMSMRKRVERAADLEERLNARAYRRAARRARIRKRWDNFLRAVNCFGSQSEPRIEDYEEKRALILQEAFLEQDLDQAEKGEVMEAEIRELRHAQEIVSSLVRVGEHRFALINPFCDPPPPLVPLPFTPTSRSRASTGTLPSYCSESLPDYSSRPQSLYHTNDPFIISSDEDDESGRRDSFTTVPPSESSSRTRYTPTSSVRDVSPRRSEETLWTRMSKDTED